MLNQRAKLIGKKSFDILINWRGLLIQELALLRLDDRDALMKHDHVSMD